MPQHSPSVAPVCAERSLPARSTRVRRELMTSLGDATGALRAQAGDAWSGLGSRVQIHEDRT
eukprot:1154487-Pelagomonas_calceolata.AAC.1